MPPLTSADLLSPKGPLDALLFPGEASNVLAARLDQYLATAYAKTEVAAQTDPDLQNSLAYNWALYLAFSFVHMRMSAEPITLNVAEKGSHGYSQAQIDTMKRFADKYHSDFKTLLIMPGVSVSRLPGSISVRNTVEW